MSGLSKQKRARVVQLYCPDHEATVDNFLITPLMTHKDVVTAIAAAFRRYKIKEAWPCDINGEPLFADADCPSTLDNVVDGERFLIALEKGSLIYPEPPLEVVLYLDGDNLPKPLRVSLPMAVRYSRLYCEASSGRLRVLEYSHAY
jgi:hypothetical protein